MAEQLGQIKNRFRAAVARWQCIRSNVYTVVYIYLWGVGIIAFICMRWLQYVAINEFISET